MDTDNGGHGADSGERQRQTAAEIARRKVLEAYHARPDNYADPEQAPKVDAEQWKKYHTAWQDYYQKYYGDYYQKAAKDYVEQAKLKHERQQMEQKTSAISKFAVAEQETVQDEGRKGRREKIRTKASDRARKIRKSKHFTPIIIGVVIILAGLFLQYNQIIFANVAAYISPGGGTVNEIAAIDGTVMAEVGPDPVLVIPKLNVEVPIVFGAANDTNAMNAAMSNGVAHFSIPRASAVPGEVGNFVISGHSAGNVYRASDYKFVFSGLDRLSNGDLIYVNYQSVRYTYSVTGKQTVEPVQVGALTYNTEKPILTLITCTPLGTSRYRLLVTAEQISPDPKDAPAPEPSDDDDDNEVEMPANDPSPLEQAWNWLTGNS